MKLVVKEHVSTITEPVVKKIAILTEATNSLDRVPLSIGLAKGDILVYAGSGRIRRLPVGTDGQVLKADSTATLGVKWANP